MQNDSFLKGYFEYEENKNYEQSFTLFEKSSEEGCTEGKYYLAYCLIRGHGAERNFERAYNLLKECIEAGMASAISELGLMHQVKLNFFYFLS
jgi:TPR repeat protein